MQGARHLWNDALSLFPTILIKYIAIWYETGT